MHTHPCKKTWPPPSAALMSDASSACAALRLYKPSRSHPRSHSITPTHTRAISKEKEKRRGTRTNRSADPSSCRARVLSFRLPFPVSANSSLSLSLFLFLVHAPSSPRVLVYSRRRHRRSLPSPPQDPRNRIATGFSWPFTHSLSHGASMKITYIVIAIGHPVRSIEGGDALAVRQVVKTALKNLKRWYVRLQRGTTSRAVDFDRQNYRNEIKISYDQRATMTLFVEEESRNCANENLENELKENLANDNKPVVGDDGDR